MSHLSLFLSLAFFLFLAPSFITFFCLLCLFLSLLPSLSFSPSIFTSPRFASFFSCPSSFHHLFISILSLFLSFYLPSFPLIRVPNWLASPVPWFDRGSSSCGQLLAPAVHKKSSLLEARGLSLFTAVCQGGNIRPLFLAMSCVVD